MAFQMDNNHTGKNASNASRGGAHGFETVLACAFAFLLAVGTIQSPGKALAACADANGGVAASSCDCKYWDTLKARAWLEAEREIVQNQNLIFKPDSVLEYTCFDSMEKEKAKYAGAIFSDNTDTWGTARGCGELCLDIALQDVTHKSMLSYLQANFDHEFLGGRWKEEDGAPSSPSIIGGGNYVCQAMIRVWEKAKCYNFDTETNDDFLSLDEYVNLPDRRLFPDPCAAKDPRWQAMMDDALKNTPWQQTVRPTNQEIFTNVADKINPADDDTACSAPVPTGIRVVSLNRPEIDDAFCTNPGCSYRDGQCVK